MNNLVNDIKNVLNINNIKMQLCHENQQYYIQIDDQKYWVGYRMIGKDIIILLKFFPGTLTAHSAIECTLSTLCKTIQDIKDKKKTIIVTNPFDDLF